MSLTPTQSQALKQLIDDRADQVLQNIRNTLPKPADETTLERTGVSQDEVDDATTNAEEHLNHTMHRHYVGELRLIDAARERVDKGLIDCCVDCGNEIGYERLNVQPFAVRCVDCQEVYERRVKANSR
jgi:RNA polymerase-binding transcription factor DksA